MHDSTWTQKLESAINARQTLLESPHTDCYRIYHGYDEGFPGVVIEAFNGVFVIDYKKDIEPDLSTISHYIDERFNPRIIISKGHQTLGKKLKDRFQVHKGSLEESPGYCHEEGVKFDIRVETPHNLGLYLDTRDARRWLRNHSKNRRILNLFAFTGSLGVSAALGGAKDVIHLDRSAELLPRLQKNYALNSLTWDQRSFLRGDIYKHLPRAIQSGQRFDGIILDPPPKVYGSPYAKERPRGQDFSQLVQLCSQLLSPDAWLMCFFHRFDKSWSESEEEVNVASGIDLHVEERLTSGIDFPESNPERKLRVSILRKPS
ncbi:class I SAM-dependent methyltransferase [Pseudobacteriovorax antillogorgiicola]|uniref:23S rRNA G2069 N7-methylase RlmK or C1962 C5-methylase RlmI n=1 Tax=Pseudobacteriovorax antillogorgiicola TaxID=1513793 RepID=A0A1Y6C8K6_9BACT|nr:class I SAM-dependent methyltransferase [Pseudobacteriovorax antillogorgiicola]TCS49767.1 23S rRNA G2069 N7-methylase RlmK/C1962 C5-methylase RlmI [Pseudobacteriovorax antillogorgiicola]SMF42636.1 23S rRNA G2069 N7-methylase RlmK or C1962 C5-methylase RlmI [Pseudobacteriovorax antillogorgiicola]